MKLSLFTTPVVLFILLVFLAVSCSNHQQASTEKENSAQIHEQKPLFQDYGKEPYVVDIEDYTSQNTNFRMVLWTGSNLQLTLMSIPVGGDIGLEVHPDIDQFLRIEQGEGQVYMGNTADNLDFTQKVEDDFAILVPAGKWHNIVNTGDKPLKLYSIYAPAEHPFGTVHKLQSDDPDFQQTN